MDDLEAVKAIFAVMFLRPTTVEEVMYTSRVYLPRLSTAVFDSCTSELTPLVMRARHDLEFFHASFPDFLMDKTRSGAYHVDLEVFCTAAITEWWVDKGLVNQSGANDDFSVES